ncbi:MAG TPA: phosphoglucomutase (alpha-D-glucose-1,6-bisphosphate-dependent) [Longimicrobiales bacterium]
MGERGNGLMRLHELAGRPADSQPLPDIDALLAAYHEREPDLSDPAQRVTFGTSGHRGSALDGSFNEAHILAITQAIAAWRVRNGVTGPLFLGIDTHALSQPAGRTALEVLAANNVHVMVDMRDGYTPTPAVSHAILAYNLGRRLGHADGIVVTPSHNPPLDGGIKYNPPHGGAADSVATRWIQDEANRILDGGLQGVRRVAYRVARGAGTTHEHDYLLEYVTDLSAAIDFNSIRASGLKLAVDPLGGAGVHYWPEIANHYNVPIEVLRTTVDPTFRFMSLDWDGRIRMDPSSPHAMKQLLSLRKKYDVAWACDTDHDRHGIVTRSGGLLDANAYLAVCAQYLFTHRPKWAAEMGIGKTIVSSSMIDRVAKRAGRTVMEVPVGFKWFVDGLMNGSLGFAGEESAGATLVRRDGAVWTTDKDGIVVGLLAAEMTAATGRDPALLYADIVEELGATWYARTDAPATPSQKAALLGLSAESVTADALAGDVITAKLTHAAGNSAAIGGLKVETARGWFAARPSGTENVYKLYAESFVSASHLARIQREAQSLIDSILGH